MQPMTKEELVKALPGKLKNNVNDELIDKINQTMNEPALYEQFRENILGYTGVLSEGRFKTEAYINAIKYVSYKLMGKSNQESYSLTFPDRIRHLAANNATPKDISSYVAIYNKSKLVNLILEQSLIPSWILNQDLYQRALNTQAELMMTAKSEKVRSDAANSLLTHLKRPETHKVELEVGQKEDSSIQELRQATLELARQQRLMIESGQQNASDIARSNILIEGQAERVS